MEIYNERVHDLLDLTPGKLPEQNFAVTYLRGGGVDSWIIPFFFSIISNLCHLHGSHQIKNRIEFVQVRQHVKKIVPTANATFKLTPYARKLALTPSASVAESVLF